MAKMMARIFPRTQIFFYFTTGSEGDDISSIFFPSNPWLNRKISMSIFNRLIYSS